MSLVPLCFAAHLGSSLEVPTTFPRFPFKGLLGHSQAQCPQTSYHTFNSFAVTSLAIVSIFILTPGIMLIYITVSFTSQLLRVTGHGSLRFLYCHLQLCNLFNQPHNFIFPLCLSHSHSDTFPGSVLLLWLSHLG